MVRAAWNGLHTLSCCAAACFILFCMLWLTLPPTCLLGRVSNVNPKLRVNAQLVHTKMSTAPVDEEEASTYSGSFCLPCFCLRGLFQDMLILFCAAIKQIVWLFFLQSLFREWILFARGLRCSRRLWLIWFEEDAGLLDWGEDAPRDMLSSISELCGLCRACGMCFIVGQR